MGIEKRYEILNKVLNMGIEKASLLREMGSGGNVISVYNYLNGELKGELDNYLKGEGITPEAEPWLYALALNIGVSPLHLEIDLRIKEEANKT